MIVLKLFESYSIWIFKMYLEQNIDVASLFNIILLSHAVSPSKRLADTTTK
jgi:hypothetical protein